MASTHSPCREMKAIFFAEGPDIKPGVKLATFQNVDLYPLFPSFSICERRLGMAT